MHNPTVSDLPINNLPGYIQNLHVTGTSYITTNPMLHSHATSHYWYINIHSHACMQSLTFLVLMQSPITMALLCFHRSMHRAHPVLPTWDTWISFIPQSQTQCTTVPNKFIINDNHAVPNPHVCMKAIQVYRFLGPSQAVQTYRFGGQVEPSRCISSGAKSSHPVVLATGAKSSHVDISAPEA